MPSISDTAYPRFKPNPSPKELEEIYTPTVFELVYAEPRAREPAPRVGLLLLLKSFQRLGYFVELEEIPPPIVQHVSGCAGYSGVPTRLSEYFESSARRKHMTWVREFVGVTVWGEQGQQIMGDACREAARTREDLADIINVAIEELVRQRHELPAFSSLLRCAQNARAEINRNYHAQVYGGLSGTAKKQLQALLTPSVSGLPTRWEQLKSEPKQPSLQHNQQFLDHLQWLRQHVITGAVFSDIADAKIKQFAIEARSLDLASINDMMEAKRFTLAAALILAQIGQALDDVADMFIRTIRKLHNKAYDALLQHQDEHVERTDALIDTLHDVTLAYKGPGSAEERLAAISEVLEPEVDNILAQYEVHSATAGRNYLPFLPRLYSHQRAALFRFLETVDLVPTSPDKSLVDAIAFMIAHKPSRQQWLAISREETKEDGTVSRASLLDLSFVSEKWWPLVTGNKDLNAEVTRVDRRLLELCVVTEVMQELQSGDLYIPDSERYSDYREQLVSDEEYRQALATYGERSGLPVDAKQFVAKLQANLQQYARKADEGYPGNEYLMIDKDGAFLKRLRRLPDPEGLREFLRLLKDESTQSCGVL
jgi:hypothetical protein